ncbi:MAG: nitroreductase, partial [Candidatus Microthrix parvicella]
LWAEKRRRDGYDAGSGATTDTPKARMATAMQHFVDHFEATLGRPQGHHGPVRRRPVEELIFDDAWEQPAPWAKDPPGTRFTGTGPSRSHASAAQRGKG